MLEKKESPSFKAAGNQMKYYKNYTINKGYIKPPYSKDLENKLVRNSKPYRDLFLFMGKYAWEKAKGLLAWEMVLVFPVENKSESYDWHFVCGLSVLLYDTTPSGSGSELIQYLVYELLKAGATIVRLINPEYVFIAEFSSGGVQNDRSL